MTSSLISIEELSSLNSEEKIKLLLIEIKESIEDCRTMYELSTLAENHPHLVPLMLCHNSELIMKKFPLFNLSDLFKLHPEFELFFFNTPIWTSVYSLKTTEDYLCDNANHFHQIKMQMLENEKNRNYDGLLSFYMSFRHEYSLFMEPGFQKFPARSLSDSINWFFKKYHKDFEDIGRYYFNLILNINRRNILSIYSRNEMDVYIQGLLAYFCAIPSMFANVVQRPKDLGSLCDVPVNDHRFADKILELFFNNNHLLIKILANYGYFKDTDLTDKRDNFAAFVHRELLQVMSKNPAMLLRFIKDEQQYASLSRDVVIKAGFIFPSLEQFVKTSLIAYKQTHPNLHAELTLIENFLSGEATINGNFKKSKSALAYELLRLTVYPESIDQGTASLCGPTTFFKILLDSHPLVAIKALLVFATQGEVSLNGHAIAMNAYHESDSFIFAFLVAIRHSNNWLGYKPNLPLILEFMQGATLNSELIHWLQSFAGFKCINASYHTYKDGQPLSGVYGLFFNRNQCQPYIDWENNFQFVYNSMQKNPNQKFILGVSKNLTGKLCRQPYDVVDATIFGIAADHWVELTGLTIDEKDRVTVTIWTYGNSFTATLPKKQLLEGWRGAIIATPQSEPKVTYYDEELPLCIDQEKEEISIRIEM